MMDWPLSREEKKDHVMRLYDRELLAANKLLDTTTSCSAACAATLSRSRSGRVSDVSTATSAHTSVSTTAGACEDSTERLRRAVEQATETLESALVDSHVAVLRQPRARSENATAYALDLDADEAHLSGFGFVRSVSQESSFFGGRRPSLQHGRDSHRPRQRSAGSAMRISAAGVVAPSSEHDIDAAAEADSEGEVRVRRTSRKPRMSRGDSRSSAPLPQQPSSIAAARARGRVGTVEGGGQNLSTCGRVACISPAAHLPSLESFLSGATPRSHTQTRHMPANSRAPCRAATCEPTMRSAVEQKQQTPLVDLETFIGSSCDLRTRSAPRR